MLTPAASLRGERPHREQAEKDHQGDRGTMAVERVHSLASPGKGTEGRFSVYANGTGEGLLTAHPSSTPGIRHAGQQRLPCTQKGDPVRWTWARLSPGPEDCLTLPAALNSEQSPSSLRRLPRYHVSATRKTKKPTTTAAATLGRNRTAATLTSNPATELPTSIRRHFRASSGTSTGHSGGIPGLNAPVRRDWMHFEAFGWSKPPLAIYSVR